MPMTRMDSVRDWLLSSLSPEVDILPDGSIEQARDNAFPNQFGQVFGEDGEPVGWDLSWNIDRIVAYYPYFTRLGGKVPFLRQSTYPLSSDEPWAQNQPIAANARNTGTVKSKPPMPEMFVEADTTRGHAGGNYGFSYGERGRDGRTTTSGEVFFDVGNSQVIACPVPESWSPGTTHIEFYLRRPGGKAPARQRSIPVERLRGRTEIILPGPWFAGKRPPATNESGLGTPQQPRINGPKRFRDIYMADSSHNLYAGRYRFGLQLAKTGSTLMSPLTNEIVVEGDTERYQVKVPVNDGSAGAGASSATGDSGGGGGANSASAGAGGGSLDPREIRPSGKLADNEYVGEEVDFNESNYVGRINDARSVPLVLTQALNRAAYRKALGDVSGIESLAHGEGYPGEARQVSPAEALNEKWRSVGIAIEDGAIVLLVGKYLETGAPETLKCQHIEDDGTVHSHDALSEDAVLSWSLVQNNKMHASYAGSYGSSVSTGLSRWQGKSRVDVKLASSNIQCAISDGSLESGVYARTYSDGRMILNSYYFNLGTANANKAVCGHEAGHTLKMPHVGGVASIMQTSFNVSSTSNPETPTSYDISELRSVWGDAVAEPTPEPNPPPPNPTPNPESGTQRTPDSPPDKPKFRLEWRTRVLPYRRKTCFVWETPRVVRKRRDLKWIPRLLIDDVAYRAYDKRSRLGQNHAFGRNRKEIKIHGVPPDQEETINPGGNIGLLQEEFPTEDTSMLEAPDPTQIPDAPTPTGSVLPAAGKYRGAVSAVYEGGAESILSDSVTTNIALNQIMNLQPVTTVNRLKNAEFGVLDANGKPKHWTFIRAGSANPGSYTTSSGVLNLVSGVTSQALAPEALSDIIPISNADVITVAGVLSVLERVSGKTRLLLEEMDADGTVVPGSGKVLAETSGAGSLPFEKLYDGTWFTDTSGIRLRLQFRGLTGGLSEAVNLTAVLSDPHVLPYNTDVRKVVIPASGSGEPASFSPPPYVPMPDQAYVAVGPVPSQVGIASPEETTPYLVAGFENGAIPAGLTPVAGGASWAVEPAAAMFGSNGLRIQDQSTTQGLARAWTYNLPAGDGAGSRFLFRYSQRPAYGFVSFCLMSSAGRTLAGWRLYSGGSIFLLYWDGKAYQEKSVVNLIAGDAVDLEIILSGMSTKNGTLTALVGKDGPRAPKVTLAGLDYRNYTTATAFLGTNNTSDNRSKYIIHLDQFIVTPNGDVLDRESPSPPTGYIPPPLDASYLANGTQSLLDQDGEPKNQLYAFMPPGVATAENPAVIPLLEAPLPVTPGRSYTIAARSRYSVFTDEPSPGLRVTLEGPGMDPLKLGSINAMTGKRGWADDFLTFTAPELDLEALVRGEPFGYTQARVELVLHSGVYVMQDFLYGKNALTTEAQRDAKRGYARAASATFQATLPKAPPHDNGIRMGNFLSRIHAEVSTPEGTSAEVLYSSSDNNTVYSEPLPDATIVEDRDYIRFSGTLTGDGREGASVPSGNIFVETWHPIGTLNRADRTEFPGVALVGDMIFDASYPDTDVDRIQGHVYTVEQTEDIGRLVGFKIGVRTEDAAREIWERSLRDEFVAEIPHAGNRVPGKSYRLRFRKQLEPEMIPEASSRVFVVDGANGPIEIPRRELYATFSVDMDEAEVIESAPLGGIRPDLLASSV